MTEADARAYQGKQAYRGLLPDGRRHYVLSQSGIKAVEICPERGRRSLLQLHPRTYTDSTAMGEAVHLAIEVDLQSRIDGQGGFYVADLCDMAYEHFDEVMAEDGSRFVKIKTVGTVRNCIGKMVQAWALQVLPFLSPQAVELHLGPTTIHEDDERVIQLEGTADYLDAVTGLADWKTTSRPWNRAEHQRWDVQPTVYTWLLNACKEDMGCDSIVSDWTWHVFQTNGDYEKIETTRGPADWVWLKQRCQTIVMQLEADMPRWFENDTHWLCSEKYCEAYAACKGLHMGDVTTKMEGI